LAEMDSEQIGNWFSIEGQPINEESKSWVASYKREVEQKFVRLPVWYRIALFRTKALADFEHWARAEFLTVDEVVCLSVGLEPNEQLVRLIKPSDERGDIQKMDEVAEYMSRHKETIRRKFDPYDNHKKPDLAILFDWIKTVKLDVHSSFMAMLEKRIISEQSTTKISAATENPDQMDGREKVSMSKLIAAMAIDCYGYDPRAKRSDIPNEIQGIADRLGLEISGDTIRKYLKKGSELIPEDWEPE